MYAIHITGIVGTALSSIARCFATAAEPIEELVIRVIDYDYYDCTLPNLLLVFECLNRYRVLRVDVRVVPTSL